MNWVNKRKLLAVKFNNQPCLEIDNLWNILYQGSGWMSQFQSTKQTSRQEIRSLDLFFKSKLRNMICNCNSSSMPEPNKLS